ncbi:MAG: hypothetical protein PVI43_01080 [Candidatus Bathyarchaeota archaeon]|jgi:hypothetical protein
MTTSEQLTGAKQYPSINVVLPLPALDIPIEDPNDPSAFSELHILDEDGNRIGAHTIRSICEVTDKQWLPLAGGTHFTFPVEVFDIYNHISKIKSLLQAYGYVLGGEDFNNSDPLAFWLLEYGLLKYFMSTSNLNKETVDDPETI